MISSLPKKNFEEQHSMSTYRVVTMTKAGKFVGQDYEDPAAIREQFEQIGVEEDSYTLRLHGEPVFKGLIGPLSEGPSVIRYETPEAYADLTEVWAKTRRPRKRRNLNETETEE
jgi:hypothetical protein